MKIKLIAIDLDGTLLTSNKQISPETVEMIERVRRKRAVRVVLCTARPPRTTLPFYKQLGLDEPMINYNGALVWNPPTGEVWLHRPIPVNIARAIITWARERYPRIRVSAEMGDKWFTDFYNGTYKTETARVHEPDLVAPVEQWLNKPLTKLLLLGKTEWLTEVNKAIQEDLSDDVTTVQTEDFLLQVMHASVSKYKALQTVAQRMGISRRRVMAIGDNANDAGMIRWAGVGVVMANGHLTSLRVADHVTDHHDEEGVANVIRDLVMNGHTPHGA
ncbi:MAG: Cof-type HAD-IIB family hydrolase [Phycisphaerae bacterium]|nr:Cof-type HAD-IIB family hydrolase [Phycisphaerae bacterium]